MGKWIVVSKQHVGFFLGVLIFFGLYLSSLYSYLLFHSLAEIFSIVVAWGIFTIAWNSRPFLANHYLLFLGIAYLFVAGVDLIHTLAYKGMGVFPGYETNLATQLWIGARYMESLSFLLAPFYLRRKLKIELAFLLWGLITVLLLLSIFYWHIFPVCFIEGKGLTPFKKISEYVISFLLFGGMVFLLRDRRQFDPAVLNWIAGSIFLTIVSELFFTFYIHAYDLSNLMGHVAKILSFFLIYKAIIRTGLREPYHLLFRELKQSEQALREERDRVQSYLDIAGVMIIAMSQDQKVTLINKRGCKVLGYAEEEIVGKDWVNTFIPQEERFRVKEVLENLFKGSIDRIEYVEHPILTRSGEKKIIAWQHATLREGSGRVVSTLSSGEDITERKKMEEKLRASHDELEISVQERTAELARANEELLQEVVERKRVEGELRKAANIIENAGFGLGVGDTQSGTIVFVNPAYARQHGFTEEEMIGMPISDVYSPEVRAEVSEYLQQLDLEGQVTFESRHIRKDGTTFPVLMNIRLMKDEAGRGRYRIVFCQDISQMKQAEIRLQEQANLLELSHDAIITCEMDGTIRFWNRGAEKMYGWKKEEAMGKGIHTLLQTKFPVPIDEIVAQIIHIGRWDGELIHKRRDETSIRVASRWALKRDEKGQPQGILEINHDITEQKEAEERTMATNVLLDLFSKKSSRREYLDAVVGLIQSWSSCRCAGIRVLDRGDLIPYGSYLGFSKEFWDSENLLSLKRDQCVCIRMITGRPDPQDLLMMTPFGSFHCANTFEFIGKVSEEEKGRFRGACMRNGFKSVAIIPIPYKEKIMGAIHLADEREGQVSSKTIGFIESVTPLIGEALNRLNLEEDLRESENRLRLLSSQLLTVQENERRRFAREIHDGLGQMLTATKFKMENLIQQIGEKEWQGKEEALSAIMPLIQETIEEARRVQMDLRPSILDDLGILATLSWLCREFQATYSSIGIEKRIDIEEEEVPSLLKTTIYRISQEALNNIAKHSRADLIRLSLRSIDGRMELMIMDNGQGFDLEEALSREGCRRGFGLSSMKERTELSGGFFRIESEKGKGTTIRAAWPL